MKKNLNFSYIQLGGDYLCQMKSAMKKMEEESSLLKMTIEKREIEVSALQGSLPDSRSYISGSQTTVPQVYIFLIFCYDSIWWEK